MTSRLAHHTVDFVDEYCEVYRLLFAEVVVLIILVASLLRGRFPAKVEPSDTLSAEWVEVIERAIGNGFAFLLQ